MKSFVILPTICIFLLTLTALKLSDQLKIKWILTISVLTATSFAAVMITKLESILTFLYFDGFISIITIIASCLTYLVNRALPKITGYVFWLRLLGLGITITIFTAAISFGITMLVFLFNPMDPKA